MTEQDQTTQHEEGQAYYLPVDAEKRFREVVRGVVFGQIDERLRMSWSMFEKVLTHFPAEVQRERDALWRRCEEQQARIDAALALCGPEGVELFHPQPTSIREHPIPGYARDRLRAALTAPVTTQTEGGS